LHLRITILLVLYCACFWCLSLSAPSCDFFMKHSYMYMNAIINQRMAVDIHILLGIVPNHFSLKALTSRRVSNAISLCKMPCIEGWKDDDNVPCALLITPLFPSQFIQYFDNHIAGPSTSVHKAKITSTVRV
jgi:hypothetical protein